MQFIVSFNNRPRMKLQVLCINCIIIILSYEINCIKNKYKFTTNVFTQKIINMLFLKKNTKI